jgi:hypothetical protein
MSQDLRDDLVRRGDVMDELVKEYNRRWQEGGLKLAWIEKAVDSARPVADVKMSNNFERLKAMSMEEMARFIAGQRGWYCDYKDPEDDEYQKVLEWLKEEVDDGKI